MKRLFLSTLAALALCGAAKAQSLNVADVETLPGETAEFRLVINVDGGEYTGFQFQMQFPETGFTLAGTTVSSTWGGASFGTGDLVSGIANGSAVSMSDTAIPDGEMEVGTVKINVDEGLTFGDYDVTISGFNFLDGTNYTPVPDVTFTVHVVSAHSVLLDENSTVAPEAAEGVNVRVLRTIKDGEWSTICLPFAMTEAQVKTAFGDDVQLGDFNDYDFDEDAGTINVMFNSATAIEANHPYIIKVGKAVASFSVEGVDIDPQDAVVDFDTDRRHRYPRKMVGVYEAGTVLDWGTLFLNGNQFWYSMGKTKMKAYRAYFNFNDLLPDFEDNYAESRISMTFSETTGIRDNRHETTGNNHYYDLQGRRVADVHKVSANKKGLYIRNGKKEIVR